MLFPKSFTAGFTRINFVSQNFSGFKRDKRVKPQRVDVIAEQVKKMLQATDQKIILMVRG